MAVIQQREYEKPSEDTHNAVIVDVVDLGLVDTDFGQKEKILVVTQVEERGKDGKRLTIFSRFTPSLHEKASFTKALRGIFGKIPSMPFDTESLVGQPFRAAIVHNEYEGKTYANIAAFMKPGKEKLEPEGYTRKKDREESAGRAPAESPVDGDEIPF